MKRALLICLATFAVTNASGAKATNEGPSFGYPLASGTFARAMATGPDDNLWFTGRSNRTGNFVVGKVTPAGDVTEVPLYVSRGFGASSIVSGPDGNLWFVESEAGAIGRSTTDGDVTSFALPEHGSPNAITAGPDGNLWFTEEKLKSRSKLVWSPIRTSKVGRITPSGQITEFLLPPDRQPRGIVTGPDDALWFVERGTNRRFTNRESNWIGRITTSGQITHFRVPGPWAMLNSITAAPDGNLWFTEEAVPQVGRITTSGQISQFPVPTRGGTRAIVFGPEGKLWFNTGFEIGAISTKGAISWPACLVPHCVAPPESLAVGPDGGLWVGSGTEHCYPQVCGGGAGLTFLQKPGGVGKYELPPLTLAIGPRVGPVRRGRTSVNVACGLGRSCRGLLRLGFFEYPLDRRRRFRLIAKSHYRVAAGRAERIRMQLKRGVGKFLPRSVLALAGPKGTVQAKSSVFLTPGRRSGR